MPNGTYGGVRGGLNSAYSIALGTSYNLAVKVRYRLGSRNC